MIQDIVLVVNLALLVLAVMWLRCIIVTLGQILKGIGKPASPPKVLHAVPQLTMGGKETKMLTDIQQGLVGCTIEDAEGEPASLPAGVTWSWASDNAAVATVAPNPADPSGLTGIVSFAGLGTCNLNGASSDGLVSCTIPCQYVASVATQAVPSLGVFVAPAPAAAASAVKK